MVERPSHNVQARRAPAGRGDLLRTVVTDGATLLLVCAVATLVAFGWLIARSGGGAVDTARSDAILAASFAAAGLPAWSATRLRVVTQNMQTARWRRVVWRALHPGSVPAWIWLAALLSVATTPSAAFAALAMCTAVVVLAVASFVVQLAWPHTPPLHSRLALLGSRPGA